MAVTRDTLIARYPEFTSTPVDLVNASIADAALMVDPTYYRAKTDSAVTAYAAHLIALNPLGELARLDKKGEKTTYLLVFQRIQRSLGAGFRTI